MILNKQGDKFEYEGVTYTVGGSIVGTPESEYEGLYGTITEILDGDDRETDNDTPDVYCSFEEPALPCEIRRLEKIFSDLYEMPKTLDDIILDCVIMAPSMIKPLDDMKKCRRHPELYVLMEDWAVDGEQGNSSEIFSDYDDARRVFLQKLREEMDNGCVLEWKDKDGFIEDSTSSLYECYLKNEYCENHYHICIIRQKLCASDRFIREMADLQLDMERKGGHDQ